MCFYLESLLINMGESIMLYFNRFEFNASAYIIKLVGRLGMDITLLLFGADFDNLYSLLDFTNCLYI